MKSGNDLGKFSHRFVCMCDEDYHFRLNDESETEKNEKREREWK